jgi:hypothetical protein
MKGIVTQAIKKCIKKGKQVKVAQRYLRAKYNVNIGNIAFQKRVKFINQETL